MFTDVLPAKCVDNISDALKLLSCQKLINIALIHY
jgi:hypothetical protein